MLIPIDFATRITVENLDTGERKIFLVPRGTERLVQIPEEMAQDLSSLVPDQLPPMAIRRPEDQPEPEEATAPASDAQGLVPGALGGELGPKDVFGASEG